MEIFNDYHRQETSEYTTLINSLCNINLEPFLAMGMKTKWTQKLLKKYNWVDNCSQLIIEERAKWIKTVVIGNEAGTSA